MLNTEIYNLTVQCFVKTKTAELPSVLVYIHQQIRRVNLYCLWVAACINRSKVRRISSNFITETQRTGERNMMQRTSVIRHRQKRYVDWQNAGKKKERVERKWTVRLHFVLFFLETNEWVKSMSKAWGQSKSNINPGTYEGNNIMRLWEEHDRLEGGLMSIWMERCVVFIRDYTSNATRGQLCLISLLLCQFSHLLLVIFHHLIRYFIILLFAAVMCSGFLFIHYPCSVNHTVLHYQTKNIYWFTVRTQ